MRNIIIEEDAFNYLMKNIDLLFTINRGIKKAKKILKNFKVKIELTFFYDGGGKELFLIFLVPTKSMSNKEIIKKEKKLFNEWFLKRNGFCKCKNEFYY